MIRFTDAEMLKINAFDWHKNFPQVFGKSQNQENAGFDVVISNPPYTYLIPTIIQEYFQKTYQFQNYQKDLYLIFLEKYSKLLKRGGTFGVIVSNTWLLSLTYLNPERGEALAEVKKMHVEMLPVPAIDLSGKQTKKLHDRLVELANQMLSANSRFLESVVQRRVYEQRIGILEKEINELVYQLYGLTAEEIAIVEGDV